MGTTRFVDLSHSIEHGMVTYPGLPGPVIGDHLSRADSAARYTAGTTFQIGRVELVSNTGTYVDAPFHRYEDGGDLADLDLASLAHLPAAVCRVPAGVRAIGPDRFAGRDVTGRAVLVHTGWDRHWRTPAYQAGHPFLTRAAAEALRDRGAALVGIDSLNIDDTADGARPVHTILLGAGIPVVEHLRGLDAVPDEGFRFYAVPVKLRGVGSFPVRAFGLLTK